MSVLEYYSALDDIWYEIRDTDEDAQIELFLKNLNPKIRDEVWDFHMCALL